MDFNATAVRVAITRLSASGLIESPARSKWRLTDKTAWSRERNRWQCLDSLVKDWGGGWLVALSSGIARSDRPEWRRNERALLHRGFREIQRDVFLRPDNFTSNMQDMKRDLVDLGASGGLKVFRANYIDFVPELAAWNIKAHRAQLMDVKKKMESLLRRPAGGSLDHVCRSFWFVGRQAIRLLNNDPLLPSSMSNTVLREQMVKSLPKFIEQGRRHWQTRLKLE
jgi:phenylacetic acid degradation operon negative regulatory protein